MRMSVATFVAAMMVSSSSMAAMYQLQDGGVYDESSFSLLTSTDPLATVSTTWTDTTTLEWAATTGDYTAEGGVENNSFSSIVSVAPGIWDATYGYNMLDPQIGDEGLTLDVLNSYSGSVDFALFVDTSVETYTCAQYTDDGVCIDLGQPVMSEGSWIGQTVTIDSGATGTLSFNFSEYWDALLGYGGGTYSDPSIFNSVVSYGVIATMTETTEVSEPAVLLMLGSGLLAMGYATRRRRLV